MNSFREFCNALVNHSPIPTSECHRYLRKGWRNYSGSTKNIEYQVIEFDPYNRVCFLNILHAYIHSINQSPRIEAIKHLIYTMGQTAYLDEFKMWVEEQEVGML